MDPVGKRPADINPGPLELASAFNDPKYWLELFRCVGDPEFWKGAVWEEIKKHRANGAIGGAIGFNSDFVDAGLGGSVGAIVGKDRTKDRNWNVFANAGGGVHLGPKEQKLIGGGAGLFLSRDGVQKGGGIGAGRFSWGTDPLNGQSAGYSKLNSRGFSVGDMATGASVNKDFKSQRMQRLINVATTAAEKALLPLLPGLKIKVTWAPGGNVQGPLITRGPMGLVFSWVIDPTMDFGDHWVVKPATKAYEALEGTRSAWLDKAMGPVVCDRRQEEQSKRTGFEPYACREKLPGSDDD